MVSFSPPSNWVGQGTQKVGRGVKVGSGVAVASSSWDVPVDCPLNTASGGVATCGAEVGLAGTFPISRCTDSSAGPQASGIVSNSVSVVTLRTQNMAFL